MRWIVMQHPTSDATHRFPATTAEFRRSQGWTEASDRPPRSGAGSGRDAWVAYAATHGVPVTDQMTRDDIVAAVSTDSSPSGEATEPSADEEHTDG